MWSLAVEVAFYAVLPLLMLLALGRRGPLRPVRVAAAPRRDGRVQLLVAPRPRRRRQRRTPAATRRSWLPAYLSWFAVGLGLALVHVLDQSRERPPALCRRLDSLAALAGRVLDGGPRPDAGRRDPAGRPDPALRRHRRPGADQAPAVRRDRRPGRADRDPVDARQSLRPADVRAAAAAPRPHLLQRLLHPPADPAPRHGGHRLPAVRWAHLADLGASRSRSAWSRPRCSTGSWSVRRCVCGTCGFAGPARTRRRGPRTGRPAPGSAARPARRPSRPGPAHGRSRYAAAASTIAVPTSAAAIIGDPAAGDHADHDGDDRDRESGPASQQPGRDQTERRQRRPRATGRCAAQVRRCRATAAAAPGSAPAGAAARPHPRAARRGRSGPARTEPAPARRRPAASPAASRRRAPGPACRRPGSLPSPRLAFWRTVSSPPSDAE